MTPTDIGARNGLSLLVTSDQRRAEAVVTAAGGIDAASASAFNALFADVARFDLARVVVDTSRVSFIGSAGLAALVRGRRACGPGTEVVLRSPSPSVRRLLELAGVDGFGVEGRDQLDLGATR